MIQWNHNPSGEPLHATLVNLAGNFHCRLTPDEINEFYEYCTDGPDTEASRNYKDFRIAQSRHEKYVHISSTYRDDEWLTDLLDLERRMYDVAKDWYEKTILPRRIRAAAGPIVPDCDEPSTLSPGQTDSGE